MSSSPPHASPSVDPQLGEPTVPLALSMFLIGAGEVIASPMMLEMAESFGVNSARVAWLPGSYALTYASLALPGGEHLLCAPK